MPKKQKKMSLGLPGRLLEVAIVVGMDQETSLAPRFSKVEDYDEEKLFKTHFRPHLLDIISGPQADDNHALMNLNGANTYSPEDWRKNLRKVKDTKFKRKTTTAGRIKSIRLLRQRATNDEEVPLSTDFLSNLPCICLPDDSKVYEKQPSSSVHYLVLTDLSGSRHYACVFTTYRTFYANKNDCNGFHLSLHDSMKYNSDRVTTSSSTKCFVPLCVCFISAKPYFDVLKTTLSCFQNEAKPFINDYENYRKVLQKFVTNLSIILCPTTSISMHFYISGLPMCLKGSNEPNEPNFLSDFDLKIAYLVFSEKPKNLFKVLTYILLEQRLVFVSSNYSLITLTIEGLLSYLRPFSWPHQYVPVLFTEIIDLVACPGIFIMGCHKKHKESILEVDNEQIVVDLDDGSLFTCAAFEDFSLSQNEGVTLECSLPTSVVDKTLFKLSRAKMLTSATRRLCLPSPVTVEDIKKSQQEDRDICNQEIEEIFIEMMIDLFGNCLDYLDYELNQFRSDSFLESRHPSYLPFYTKAMKTYMFRTFIKDRFRLANDHFAHLASRSKPLPSPKQTPKRSTVRVRSMFLDAEIPFYSKQTLKPYKKHKRHNSTASSSQLILKHQIQRIDSGLPFNEIRSSSTSINLPVFPKIGTNFDAGLFYERCITSANSLFNSLPSTNHQSVTDKLTKDQNARKRAGLLIFRGCYHIANSDYLLGLRDLHETAKEDFNMFPERVIKHVMTSLAPDERAVMRNEAFYEGDEFYDACTNRCENGSFYNQELPYLAIDKRQFSRILEQSDVTSEAATIDHLFEVLASVDDAKIHPECFAAFFQTWQQGRHECEVARRRILESIGVSESCEEILKISGLVSSNKSNGRLVLTDRKILFLTDGFQQCKTLLRLTQILKMKIGKQKNPFRTKSTLVLKFEEESVLRVALGSEADLWMLFIQEMKIGRILSRDWKDQSTSSESAAKSIKIADSLYQAAKDGEDFMNDHNPLTLAKKFCNLTTLQESGQLNAVPLETYEMLVLRIDSAPKESKKTNISGICYSSAGASRVWVALDSGKVRWVNGTTWALDHRPIKDCGGKLTCMLMVNDQELWIGSSDRNIYVVRVGQMKKIRILHEHPAPLVSLIRSSSRIVSASSNGVLKVWKENENKSEKSIELNVESLISISSLSTDLLCCCTPQSIIVTTIDGRQLQKLFLMDFFSTTIINSLITCCHCTEDSQIWCGDSTGTVYVWWKRRKLFVSSEDSSKDNIRYVPRSTLLLFGIESQRSVTCLISSGKYIWFGDSVGDITIVDIETVSQERVLKAHSGAVTCLSAIENRYVVSGSASKDGKIAIWRLFRKEMVPS